MALFGRHPGSDLGGCVCVCCVPRVHPATMAPRMVWPVAGQHKTRGHRGRRARPGSAWGAMRGVCPPLFQGRGEGRGHRRKGAGSGAGACCALPRGGVVCTRRRPPPPPPPRPPPQHTRTRNTHRPWRAAARVAAPFRALPPDPPPPPPHDGLHIGRRGKTGTPPTGHAGAPPLGRHPGAPLLLALAAPCPRA